MWKYLLILLMVIHGLIHFMGFAKAYRFAQLEKLNMEISRPMGLSWLIVGLSFATAAFLLFRDKEIWIVVAIVAIFISQLLIFYAWHEAKWGSLANILIALAVILAFGIFSFYKDFKGDVKNGLSEEQVRLEKVVTENDLSLLPLPVRQYLKYCGVLGKPLTRNVRVEFEGEMRDKGKDWFPFRSVQYNFYPENTRLFFMKAKMFGMTVPGYHRFTNGKASMDIRLFGLIPVVRHTGPEMDISETVTLFNDMCLLSPSSLLEADVQWQLMDDFTVRANFTHNGISITAVLWFNEEGQLINFTSEDRYVMNEKKKYRFSTPVHGYKKWGDMQIVAAADAVWHFPDGEFTYGRFRTTDLEYNTAVFR